MQLYAPAHERCFRGNSKDPLLTAIRVTLLDPVYVLTASYAVNTHQTTVIMAINPESSITTDINHKNQLASFIYKKL
jgi:hypothetical protein